MSDTLTRDDLDPCARCCGADVKGTSRKGTGKDLPPCINIDRIRRTAGGFDRSKLRIPDRGDGDLACGCQRRTVQHLERLRVNRRCPRTGCDLRVLTQNLTPARCQDDRTCCVNDTVDDAFARSTQRDIAAIC